MQRAILRREAALLCLPGQTKDALPPSLLLFRLVLLVHKLDLLLRMPPPLLNPPFCITYDDHICIYKIE